MSEMSTMSLPEALLFYFNKYCKSIASSTAWHTKYVYVKHHTVATNNIFIKI